ncbi:MAG: MFS transporter [Dermatophilaceae bacterium]
MTTNDGTAAAAATADSGTSVAPTTDRQSASTDRPSETTHRLLVPAVVVAMTLLSAGSFVIFPLLPTLQGTLGVSTAAIGYLAAAGFAAALVAELVLAPLADRGHARAMAVGGTLLVAAGLAGSALATDGWHLVAGRALVGFGFGMFVSAASALLVRSDPARSGERLGRLGAAELAGIAVGPMAAGAAVAVASPTVILAVSAGTVLVAAPVVLAGFREMRTTAADDARFVGDVPSARGTHGEDDTHAVRPSSAPAPRVSLDLLTSRRVVGIVLLYAAVMVPTGAYDGVWPRFMTDLGADPLLTAASYALFAVPFVLVSGWAGRLADRRGGVSAFARGLAVLLPIIGFYGVVGSPWVATGMGFVESTGQALAFIGAAAAMAHTVDPGRAGSAQGLLRGIGLLAATAAAAGSGLAYDGGGALLLFGGTAVAVAILAGLGLVLAPTDRARTRVREEGGA